jgi:hypothetical protein
LPLIIFWNAATGHPQPAAGFVLGILEPCYRVGLQNDPSPTKKSIVSILSILAYPLLSGPNQQNPKRYWRRWP